MNTRHENADGPEDIDKAFAEIVAELERDSSLPQWPGDSGTEAAAATGTTNSEAPPGTGEDDGPRDWTPPEAEEDEGHYEPPEPPPLPKPGAGTVGGVVLVALGLLTLFVPFAASSLGPLTLPVGLIAISGGIGWLLLRLRQGSSDEDSGWDDGAQV
ncbi:hypothetical protein CDG81_16165 [Actinopolyspora erythraea]|uniref:DUF308 domain-containing protein n=1 Tax=Actinopolyspora erythraea TaxID=414996 RepID=A0A099D6T4_9ACTN|nr:DUF308 domain-containing protein [Actinopolyspora erythraea]ASU79551.1 hypothetical protein CDG81_16165 [Actinopolyspora erythraea]KGI81060.1 hypothetical protein IL38_13575 [Actinopolyspora erythraea]